MVYDHGTHRTQYDGSPYQNQNCTPTSGANAARELTQGAYDVSGATIRSLVLRSEETNPDTPGWSLDDLQLAMRRAGIAFSIMSGTFAAITTYVRSGYAVVLQGDSDQFSDATCSGAFNGDHCVCIHPDPATTSAMMLLADPICRTRRWESTSVLKRYTEKLAGGSIIRFGYMGGMDMSVVFDTKRATVKAGVAFYETPKGKVIGTFSSAATITVLGPSLSAADSDGVDYAWLLGLVVTSAVDDKLRSKLVWIKSADLIAVPTDNEWDASILRLLRDPAGRYPAPPAPSDPDALVAAHADGFYEARDRAAATVQAATDNVKAMVD
jgi:hypothetical protein